MSCLSAPCLALPSFKREKHEYLVRLCRADIKQELGLSVYDTPFLLHVLLRRHFLGVVRVVCWLSRRNAKCLRAIWAEAFCSHYVWVLSASVANHGMEPIETWSLSFYSARFICRVRSNILLNVEKWMGVECHQSSGTHSAVGHLVLEVIYGLHITLPSAVLRELPQASHTQHAVFIVHCDGLRFASLASNPEPALA